MVIKRSMHLINLHFWAYPNHDVLGSSIDWETTEDFMYLVPSWDKTVIFQRIFFWHFKFDRDTEAGDFVEHFDYNNHHLNRLARTSEYTSKFTKKTAVKVKTCILFPNHIPSLQRWIKRWKNTHLKTSWSAYQLRLICGEVWSSDVIIEAYLL